MSVAEPAAIELTATIEENPLFRQIANETNVPYETVAEVLTEEKLKMNNNDLKNLNSMLVTETRVLKHMVNDLNHKVEDQTRSIQDNKDKIKLNKQLPYLVASITEILDGDEGDDVEDGVTQGPGMGVSKTGIVKTTTRQTIYLPTIGLINPDELSPNDLVGVNKDSYLVLDKLPPEYDSRVQAMEIDERPKEDYSDIGGCDKQIKELIEAVVLPMTHADMFKKLGIKPPKGVLLHGPPGTGKTLLARAIAAQSNCTFLKLAGPQLVQMFIGDGAKIVRDAFELAKSKAPAIIFIDEIDAVGTRRQDAELSGDREVQRTMLELLNQLDGFSSDDRVKVIAATNRPDTLDSALLRSGRLDRKVELPHPNLEGRERILEIHSRHMNVEQKEVSYKELAKATDNFNGAQLKAVTVEAGMVALRRGATELCHEDFVEGVLAVEAKKKNALDYFT
eukprot:GHVH01013103.1.p1 GENE.GHVH01013103.1~~GHVH01013103.1.p1  ORF type:complete len:479 (+),score=75.43 GHVH01013103.1:90-1439(+)